MRRKVLLSVLSTLVVGLVVMTTQPMQAAVGNLGASWEATQQWVSSLTPETIRSSAIPLVNRILGAPHVEQGGGGAPAPTVTTDKPDYKPGETVLISGSGFAPSEQVRLQVTHADDLDGGAGHEPWYVVADGGAFTATWYVELDDSAGATLLLTADGVSSGLHAETTFTDNPAANIDQCRNGAASTPNNCLDLGGATGWVNGNANGTQSHFIEGYSIPYRVKMTELPLNTPLTVDFKYDIKHSGGNAIDFLTHYQRLEPHTGFGHPAETVTPLSGISDVSATVTTYPIPTPNTVGSPVAGQPATRFTALPANERVMTLFGGVISNVAYVSQGSLTANTSSTIVRITFTADSATAVLAWGGHIARAADWGAGNSASGIDGSPYHMALEDWDCVSLTPCPLGNLGSQDRQLQAAAVFPTGTIIIIKELLTDSADGTFNFQRSFNGVAGNFSLTTSGGSAQTQFNDVLANRPNSVTELGPPTGYTFVDVSCTDPDGGSTVSGQTATIDLDANETVTCTFRNQEDFNVTRGRIIVDKVTDPSGDTTSFNFDASGTGYADFSLTDAAAPNNSGALVPGPYSVSETVPSGWSLTSATCVSDDNPANTDPANINLAAGEVVTCTFNNSKDAHIIVDKVTTPSGDSQSFSFDAGGGLYADFSLTDATTPDDQTLAPGTYSVAETVPAGWTLTSSPCVSSKGDTETIASISLQAGETVTCTFNNRKSAHIIVDKVTDPSGDITSFSFDAGGGLYADFSLTDAATPNDQTLEPGSYSVAETVPAGWTLTSSPCVSSKGDTETIGAISLDAGETVTCTFNNRKDAHIIVDKVTDPTGDTTSFSFDAGGGLYADFGLTDTATPNDQTLVPGSYSVAETVPAGWTLTSSPCVSSKGDTETIGAISLDAGETVTCTFNNRKDAHIIVDKVTDPTGDTTSFSFDAGGGLYADFGLTDAATPNDQTLVPGSYSVAETVPAGWTLTSSPCVSSKGDAETIGAISLQAGETVTCTFNNRKNSSIVVDKVTDPTGDTTSFSFDATGTGYADFSLTDAATPNSQTLAPGTYSVAETVPAGWTLTSSPCVSSKGDTETIGAISLDAGETVTCTFNDRKDAHIIVDKVTNPSGDTTSFSFDATGTGYGDFNLTDAATPNDQTLVPGSYSVAETVPAGWDLTSSPCVSSKGDTETIGAISLDAGETVTCTFTNTKRGRIVVDKVTNPSGDTTSFSFDASGSGYVDFNLTDAAAPNSQEVVPGAYSVSETVPTGWDLTSATCDLGETPASLDVGPGETVTCTFTNRKKGMVTLHKLTNGLDSLTMTWNFSLKGGTNGSAVDTTDSSPPTTVDFGGVKLTPGVTYTICETGIPAGWTLEWKVDTNGDGTPDTIIPFFAGGNTPPTPWTSYSNVYDPNYVAPPGTYTNDTRCVQFTVQPGQTLAFEINNSFPGGEPRTIGYWKNWNTCTGGRQQITAASNGGPAAGWYILDNLLNNPGYHLGPAGAAGLTLDGDPTNVLTGTLTGSDCVAGVRILDKSRITDGKKSASDGAYNMAAQLLAALLNLSAGAETCGQVVTAVNAAQSLLVQIGFNGTAQSYLKSGALFSQANGLASTLDQYNNGNLCTP